MNLDRHLYIVPARAGSKGIRDKNLKNVGGVQLYKRTLDLFSDKRLECAHVVFSTDIPRENLSIDNINCLHLNRSKSLASDSVPMVDVVFDAIRFFESEREQEIEFIHILQPTSPFRKVEHILEASQLISKNAVDSVIFVTKNEDYHPARMYKLDSTQNLISLDPANETNNRQKLPVIFHRSGLVYSVTRKFLEQNGRIYGGHIKYLETNVLDAVNIDNKVDLMFANFLVESGFKDDSNF